MEFSNDKSIEYLHHQNFGITPTHIVDRLHGSISKKELDGYREKVNAEIARINRHALTLPEKHQELYRREQTRKIRSQYEGFLENTLHSNPNGPYHLNNPDIAKLVIDAWKFQTASKGLVVIAVCIMSNHVHALVRGPDDGTVIEAGPIMHSVKSFTARKANKQLDRTGLPFWEHRYFD